MVVLSHLQRYSAEVQVLQKWQDCQVRRRGGLCKGVAQKHGTVHLGKIRLRVRVREQNCTSDAEADKCKQLKGKFLTQTVDRSARESVLLKLALTKKAVECMKVKEALTVVTVRLWSNIA